MTQLFSALDESWHSTSAVEEWTFSWWSPDTAMAGWTMYRVFASNQIWYCFGMVRGDKPLLHVAEFDISRRPNPMIAKAESLWAEFICDAPFEQWTLGNETYAVELDDPDEGLGRAYGRAVPIASDLEWYANGPVSEIELGYQQSGLILGIVETDDGPLEFSEIAAHRTHRWSTEISTLLKPVTNTSNSVERLVPGEFDQRLAFRLPDHSVWDAVVTSDGWHLRTSDDGV